MRSRSISPSTRSSPTAGLPSGDGLSRCPVSGSAVSSSWEGAGRLTSSSFLFELIADPFGPLRASCALGREVRQSSAQVVYGRYDCRTGLDPELRADGLQVRSNRFDADREPQRDFLVRHSGHQRVEDVHFALRESEQAFGLLEIDRGKLGIADRLDERSIELIRVLVGLLQSEEAHAVELVLEDHE